MHRLLLHNDDILDAAEACLSPGQTGLMNGWGVFSTLRVSEGALFAFHRHWERMRTDAGRMRVPFPSDPEWLHSRLLRLVEANGAHNATLRVAIVRNSGGPFGLSGQRRDFDLIAFTTDLPEWPDSVRLGIKPQARHAACEFAGAKILSWSQNLNWFEEAHERGYDEFVLLNERGEVSECTSANIFTIESNRVWTPPIASGCLGGITRAILLEEINVPGIQIGERTVMPADLARADSVFITSSTRDVLPVSFIEGITLRNKKEVVRDLQRAFLAHRLQAAEQPQPLAMAGT